MLFLMKKKLHSQLEEKKKKAREYILNTSRLVWTQPQWGWMSLCRHTDEAHNVQILRVYFKSTHQQ